MIFYGISNGDMTRIATLSEEESCEEIRFTNEELDYLEQCLSKHFYSIGGMPEIIISCYEKIQKLKENKGEKSKGLKQWKKQ